MKQLLANFKLAGLSALFCASVSNAQFSDITKWSLWEEQGNRTHSSYINFSATVAPYPTWTSPDHGGAIKGTILQLGPTSATSRCYIVETLPAEGGAMDTKIWTFQNAASPQALADDPDGQFMAKFVFWATSTKQFIVSPYSTGGNSGNFQLRARNIPTITTEAACDAYKPTWSYFRGGTIVRYH